MSAKEGSQGVLASGAEQARDKAPQVQRRSLDLPTLPLRGVHLIEASAGTGKTYTITSLFVRFLIERELSIDQILAVTFTKAATRELKDRISARVLEVRDAVKSALGSPPEERRSDDPLIQRVVSMPHLEKVERLLSVAVRDADQASVFTIHGFAGRMLRDHAFESGAREGTELIGDQGALVRDVVTDFWSTRVATLSRSIFEQIGGSRLYSKLQKVGQTAAGAFEMIPVEVEQPSDFEEALAQLHEKYSEVREPFYKEGAELLELLTTSPALNRNKMRVASLEGDYRAYCTYFRGDKPGLTHPETERFTQEKVSSSAKKGKRSPEHPLLLLLGELQEADRLLKLAASQFADRLRADLCAMVSERVWVEHRRAGTQSFDGLLSDLARALRDSERGETLAREIRKLLPIALVDEFQDTDPIQFEIFSRIYGTDGGGASGACGLYLIGDPKQSIYAFRGADIQTYLKAASETAEGLWTLSTSYRASPTLVRAQNSLFQNTRLPFDSASIVYPEVSASPQAEDELFNREGQPVPGLRLIDCPPKTDWLAFIAREIARFLGSCPRLSGRPVVPGDIAVLTRSNRQAAIVQDHLRALQIPAVMQGDRSVFDAPEALELRVLLLALEEPSRTSLCRTALATRTLGLGAEELLGLDEDLEALEQWSGRFRAWGQQWQSRGVAHALSALQREVDFVPRSLRFVDGERRVTNFRHLLELLHEAEASEHLGAAGLLSWLEAAIFDPSVQKRAPEGRQLRLESDADAVTLSTGHKSKGLEYNIVFLPSLGQADRKWSEEAFRFFDEEVHEARLEMRGKEARSHSEEIHSKETRRESLRLAYVALTRAKHHVVVLCGASKSFSALSYFLHESGSTSPGGSDAFAHRLKTLRDEVRYSEMRELCEQSQGAIVLSAFSDEEVSMLQAEEDPVELFCPDELPSLRERERTSSFSAMTRDSHQFLSRAAREGRDLDEALSEGDEGVAQSVAAPGGEEVGVPLAEPTPSTLCSFPRGARPGDALHAVFEHSPFQEGSCEERSLVVARELSKRDFDVEDIEAARLNLEQVLAVSLVGAEDGVEAGGAPISLGSLSPSQRSAEMEFSFPVGSPEKRLSPARLARAMGYAEVPVEGEGLGDGAQDGSAKRGGDLLSQGYLKRVSELSFVAWSGFLRGFMDLVFEHKGKLYVVDYKSNFLGPHYEDYSLKALTIAMEEHHYFVQALLYAVAVHRYGRSRISGYSYQKHFGGIRYLFLRGMHPDHGQNGVCSFRPQEALIASLDEALGDAS